MATNASQAFLDWIMNVAIFLVFGGLGAGVVAIGFDLVIGNPFSEVLYAVIFGGTGLLACQSFRDTSGRDT